MFGNGGLYCDVADYCSVVDLLQCCRDSIVRLIVYSGMAADTYICIHIYLYLYVDIYTYIYMYLNV